MKIKRIRKLRITSEIFEVTWQADGYGAAFSFENRTLTIGCKYPDDIVNNLLHELMEIVFVVMNVRLNRPDILDDYIFVFDHRQFDTAMNMFTGLADQFIT